MGLRTTMAVTAFLWIASMPTSAQEKAAAYGQTDGVLICNKTDEGLVVAVAQFKPTRFGWLDVETGDSCLSIIAGLPMGLTPTMQYGELGVATGETTRISPDSLIWILAGANVSQAMLACDIDEHGELTTSLYDPGTGPLYVPPEGAACMDTLSVVETMGMRARSSILAPLGRTEENISTLMFAAAKADSYAALECTVDPVTGGLVTTSLETSEEGVVDLDAVESCFETIARLRATGMQISDPVPASRGSGATDDRTRRVEFLITKQDVSKSKVYH